jgi:hypothetical protein
MKEAKANSLTRGSTQIFREVRQKGAFNFPHPNVCLPLPAPIQRSHFQNRPNRFPSPENHKFLFMTGGDKSPTSATEQRRKDSKMGKRRFKGAFGVPLTQAFRSPPQCIATVAKVAQIHLPKIQQLVLLDGPGPLLLQQKGFLQPVPEPVSKKPLVLPNRLDAATQCQLHRLSSFGRRRLSLHAPFFQR